MRSLSVLHNLANVLNCSSEKILVVHRHRNIEIESRHEKHENQDIREENQHVRHKSQNAI